jgi:hypothetical protein
LAAWISHESALRRSAALRRVYPDGCRDKAKISHILMSPFIYEMQQRPANTDLAAACGEKACLIAVLIAERPICMIFPLIFPFEFVILKYQVLFDHC